MGDSHVLDGKSRPQLTVTREIVNGHAKIPAAIHLLLQAHLFATDAGRDSWDFAVEIRSLRREGLNESHFRWLVCKGFVEHADEITLLGQDARTFRPMGALTFTDTTCFVLTAAGVEFTTELLRGHRTDNCVQGVVSTNGNGTPESTEVQLPHWDSDRHELLLGNYVVKHFKLPAPNQEAILRAFEEDGWATKIDDPIPPAADQEPKQRLRDTIKSLNRNQKNRLMQFSGDGSGQGVLWELVDHSHVETE